MPPAGRLLVDDAGRPLARFLEDFRDGRRFADLLEPTGVAPVGALVGAALRDLAGWRVASPPDLARRLIAAGGRPGRHAHVMRRSLTGALPSVWEHAAYPGVRIGPVDCGPAAIAPAMLVGASARSS